MPPSASPTSVGLAASVFVLRPDQMAGYKRMQQTAVGPGAIAQDESQPPLAATLQAEGFGEGARATYAPPSPAAGLPFGQVVSTAIVFKDAAGAGRFFSEEAARRNQQPSQGGTVAPVTDLPRTGVDDLTAYSTEGLNGDEAERGFLVLLRRGRVVAEVFLAGPSSTATHDEVLPVLSSQVMLLQQSSTISG